MSSKPLKNARHERFAQVIASGACDTQEEAYERAGYKSDRYRKSSSRLRNRPEVAARIAWLLKEGARKAGVSAEQVVTELGRLALSDVRKLFHPDGTLRNVHDLDDETAAAVSSIKVMERRTKVADLKIDGDPDQRRPVVTVTEIKLHDKIAALGLLGKHHGLYVERHEVTGARGGPIEVQSLSDDDLRAEIARLIGQAVAVGAGDGDRP